MAQALPYSGVPETQIEVNPTPTKSTDLPADAFGGVIARAVQGFGRTVEGVQKEVQDVQMRMEHQRNETQVNDAANMASTELGKIEAEYRQLHGNDAVSRLPEYQTRIAKVGEQIGKGLGDNQDVQRAFHNRFGTYAASTENSFGMWAASQGDQAYVKSLEAGVEQAQSRLVRTAGLGQAEPHYDELVENVARLGQKLGWDKATTDSYLQKQAGDVVNNLITARISNGQFDEAKRLFDDAAKANVPGTDVPFLDSDHQATISARIASEMRSAQSLSRAESAQDAHDIAQSDVKSRLETGIPVVTPGSAAEATLKAGMTPRQREAYESQRDRADTIFRATGDMRSAPTGDIDKKLNELKPRGGELDFASRQAAFEHAQTLAQNIITQRRTDPGRAVIDAFPTQVGGAWQAYNAQPTPENLQAAMRASQTAQQALGIFNLKDRVVGLMPVEMARNVAAQIVSAPPGQAYETLQARANQFGPYWNSAFNQMAKDLPPAYKVAAIMPNGQMAALMIETSRQEPEKLRQALGVPASGDKSLSYTIGQDLADIRASLSQRQGGGATATALANATELLALGLMQTRGMSQAEAGEAAFKATVMDKYQIGRVNDRPFHVQSGRPVGTIESGALAMQKSLADGVLDLPRQLPPGLSAADAAAQYGNTIRDNGYWVTNDNVTGLILYGPTGVPVTIDGQEVTYTFDQLQQSGLSAPKPYVPERPITGPFGANTSQPTTLPPISADDPNWTGMGTGEETVRGSEGWTGKGSKPINTAGFPLEIRRHIETLGGDRKKIVDYLNEVDPAGRLRGVTKVPDEPNVTSSQGRGERADDGKPITQDPYPLVEVTREQFDAMEPEEQQRVFESLNRHTELNLDSVKADLAKLNAQVQATRADPEFKRQRAEGATRDRNMNEIEGDASGNYSLSNIWRHLQEMNRAIEKFTRGTDELTRRDRRPKRPTEAHGPRNV